ncbi:MAG: hypothetical protein WCC87_05905 [Candidatus Korobacteraceae bacterium]
MSRKFVELLEESGIPLHSQSGGTAPDRIVDREPKNEPCPRAKRLRDLYFQTLSSATNEFPYWYTRKYTELDGEIPAVRSAAALKEALSHLTPVIFPGELLAMGKAHYYRGSFPMPWLSEACGHRRTSVPSTMKSSRQVSAPAAQAANEKKNYANQP